MVNWRLIAQSCAQGILLCRLQLQLLEAVSMADIAGEAETARSLGVLAQQTESHLWQHCELLRESAVNLKVPLPVGFLSWLDERHGTPCDAAQTDELRSYLRDTGEWVCQQAI